MALYLVQYGKLAHLGCFAAAEASYSHGDRVVLAGPRGFEIGRILCEPHPRFAARACDGDILRLATPVDDESFEALEQAALDLLDDARRRVESYSLPMDVIDVELPLEGRTAILHGLAWSNCDATQMLEELGTRFDRVVRFLDLAHISEPTAEEEGCGKPGCGSSAGGCGSCSSGGCASNSCASGEVKGARELTAYFADLRQQMEAAPRRVPLA